MDYCRLNRQLVRNIYKLPTVGKTMTHLEGFQYETTLDLNIVYHTIIISSASQDTKYIVT